MVDSSSLMQSVLVIGLAGTGKSSILNTLSSGDPHCKNFMTKDSRKAVTLDISHKRFPIKGVGSDKNFNFIDVPGLFGGDQNFASWVKSFEAKLRDSKVSLILLVIRSSDRLDDANAATALSIKDTI